MPLVKIAYRSGSDRLNVPEQPERPRIDEDLLISRLAAALLILVADALTVPGTEGELHPHEIEVEVVKFRGLEIHGENDIEIVVFANEYPERRANLHERRRKISEGVRYVLSKNTRSGARPRGFVWVLLAPGSFEEF